MPRKNVLVCVAYAREAELVAIKTRRREKSQRKTNIMTTETTGVETRRSQSIYIC